MMCTIMKWGVLHFNNVVVMPQTIMIVISMLAIHGCYEAHCSLLMPDSMLMRMYNYHDRMILS